MSTELKPCPCGKVPECLHIGENGQGGKFATCAGSCCGDWETEFRCDYASIDSNGCYALATEAWNGLKRGDIIDRQGNRIVALVEDNQRLKAEIERLKAGDCDKNEGHG